MNHNCQQHTCPFHAEHVCNLSHKDVVVNASLLAGPGEDDEDFDGNLGDDFDDYDYDDEDDFGDE